MKRYPHIAVMSEEGEVKVGGRDIRSVSICIRRVQASLPITGEEEQRVREYLVELKNYSKKMDYWFVYIALIAMGIFLIIIG